MEAWGMEAWGSGGLEAWRLGSLEAWSLEAWGLEINLQRQVWDLGAWRPRGLEAWKPGGLESRGLGLGGSTFRGKKPTGINGEHCSRNRVQGL